MKIQYKYIKLILFIKSKHNTMKTSNVKEPSASNNGTKEQDQIFSTTKYKYTIGWD